MGDFLHPRRNEIGVSRLPMALAALALGSTHQSYLLEARQMQAVGSRCTSRWCASGSRSRVIVLFVEWRYLRASDELKRTLAKRWSKVMVALFAVGVITGTILSFEMGLLWPEFTATFGSLFGWGSRSRASRSSLKAIFTGIHVYGWGACRRGRIF